MQESEVDVDGLMDQFHAYLAKNQLKTTRQRDLIAQKFFAANGHISIEELLALTREESPRIGYATVYRTLKLLAESGLAYERHFGDGASRYEVAREDEHHDHLICLDCGKIVEFEDDEIERLQVALAEREGFVLKRHKHELYGLCPRCRERERDG